VDVLLSSQTINCTVKIRGRFEKVKVELPVNKFTAVYGDPSVHFLVHNSMRVYVTLIQTNSVKALTSYFFLRSNLILPCYPFHLLNSIVILRLSTESLRIY
jgi:hypothetical protein